MSDISPKKSPRSKIASASSPAPGMYLLIIALPSRTTYISEPSSPSWNREAPAAKRSSFEKVARVISSRRDSPCSRNRRILSLDSTFTAPAFSPAGCLRRRRKFSVCASDEKKLRSCSFVPRSLRARLCQKLQYSWTPSSGLSSIIASSSSASMR